MKKIIAFTLMVCIIALSATTVFATSETSLYVGDSNADGKINVKDATLIQKHIAGIVTLSDEGYKSADTNDDGKVNVKDATLIQKFVAGIVSQFPGVDNPGTDNPSTGETTIVEGKQKEYEEYFKAFEFNSGKNVKVESPKGSSEFIVANDGSVYADVVLAEENNLKVQMFVNSKDLATAYFSMQDNDNPIEWLKLEAEDVADDSENMITDDLLDLTEIFADVINVEYQYTKDGKDTVIVTCEEPFVFDTSELTNVKYYLIDFTYNGEKGQLVHITWEDEYGSTGYTYPISKPVDFDSFYYNLDLETKTLTHWETDEVINVSVTETTKGQLTDDVEIEVVFDSDTKTIINITNKKTESKYTFFDIDTVNDKCEVPANAETATEDDVMGIMFTLMFGFMEIAAGNGPTS